MRIFPVNLFVLIVSAAILYGVTFLSIPLLSLLMLLIVPVTIGFISVFSIWGAIDKYMMPEMEAEEEESVFSDERIFEII
ncbi:MAG: hypothetical protein L6V93_14760 [Clostridiales bacterium]|nr:MAG: hypothetical protein L6V93_14760 [Clostridiales bacterium]